MMTDEKTKMLEEKVRNFKRTVNLLPMQSFLVRQLCFLS